MGKKIRIMKWKKIYLEKEISTAKKVELLVSNEMQLDGNGFVDEYSKYYYIPEDNDNSQIGREKDENCPKSIIQTPEWIEKNIMSLMEKDNWELKDVIRILAWKTGNIDFNKSNKNDSIEYKEGWDEEKGLIKLRNQKSYNPSSFNEFAQNVIFINKKYKNSEITEKEVWIELVESLDGDKDVSGIGTVYLITLLYFITKGKCPIYDRFAMAALLSFKINENEMLVKPYCAKIVIKALPDKKSSRIKKLLDGDNVYNNYCSLLKEYFESKWETNKEIDKALWVYGHFFNTEQ